MPKMAAKMRKKVDKAEAVSGEFEPLKPGKYIATLDDVEVRTTGMGDPMWVAVFTDITDLDGERQPGRQWLNLNLPQEKMPEHYTKGEEKWESFQRMCEGRLKSFFEAFGMTTDSDTDEFLADRCVIVVGRRTIKSGPRAGELTNSVNGVAPLDSVDHSDAESEDGGDNF